MSNNDSMRISEAGQSAASNRGMEQTRRGFVKTAGIALAGAAAIGLAGCAPSGSSDASVDATAEGTWDEEFDVIVVGGGIAGQAAALTVATEGNGARACSSRRVPRPVATARSAKAMPSGRTTCPPSPRT